MDISSQSNYSISIATASKPQQPPLKMGVGLVCRIFHFSSPYISIVYALYLLLFTCVFLASLKSEYFPWWKSNGDIVKRLEEGESQEPIINRK